MEKNQQNTLLTNLYNSRDEGQLGLILMKCTPGRVFAHRYALTAGSDYFRGMFSHNNIETDTNTIFFPDTSAEVMNIIVKYIYAQKLPTPPEITDTLVRETFVVADKMQMTDLFEKYWSLYTTPITIHNFLNIWPLAEMFNRTETKENVRRFVLKNMKQISKSHVQADISADQLENIFDLIGPDDFGEVVDFLLTWVDKNASFRDDKMKCVSKLIAKFDLTELPDHALRKLMSDDEMRVKTPEIYDRLSKQTVSRWLTDARPRLVIHAFENLNRKWKHSIFYTNYGEWMLPDKKEWKSLNQWFPAVSGRGELFYFTFSRTPSTKQTFIAYESATGASHTSAVSADLKIRSLVCETSNCDAMYFERTSKSSSRFDFRSKRWDVVDFNDSIKDCDCMLLANDEKYFFDVDERRIKIVDRVSDEWVVKEKLAGSWKSIRCKNLCRNGAGKLVFFQDSPARCLLVYDLGSDSWSLIPAAHIKDELVMYVCCYDDCLVFENSADSYNVYSLKSMRKVAEYKVPAEYEGRIHFDVSVKEKCVLC